MRIAVAILTAALAGCACNPIVIREPVEVIVERPVVKPIAPELLKEHPIATGPLSECPQVAARRRAELEQCNADKATLRETQ